MNQRPYSTGLRPSTSTIRKGAPARKEKKTEEVKPVDRA